MIVLALDTSETVATVTLCEDEKILSSFYLDNGHTHSENVLPIIENVMKLVEKKYSDIELFACSAGPGSFTGVRIGVSTLKGLAFGRKIPCVQVSSLEAMAYSFAGLNGIICPSMDARRGQLYNALFKSENGTITRITDDRTISAADLSEELKNFHESIYICGCGYDILKKECDGLTNITDTPMAVRKENAYGVAQLAIKAFKEGNTITDEEIRPTYLRPSQAERMKNGDIS